MIGPAVAEMVRAFKAGYDAGRGRKPLKRHINTAGDVLQQIGRDLPKVAAQMRRNNPAMTDGQVFANTLRAAAIVLVMLAYDIDPSGKPPEATHN